MGFQIGPKEQIKLDRQRGIRRFQVGKKKAQPQGAGEMSYRVWLVFGKRTKIMVIQDKG